MTNFQIKKEKTANKIIVQSKKSKCCFSGTILQPKRVFTERYICYNISGAKINPRLNRVENTTKIRTSLNRKFSTVDIAL